MVSVVSAAVAGAGESFAKPNDASPTCRSCCCCSAEEGVRGLWRRTDLTPAEALARRVWARDWRWARMLAGMDTGLDLGVLVMAGGGGGSAGAGAGVGGERVQQSSSALLSLAGRRSVVLGRRVKWLPTTKPRSVHAWGFQSKTHTPSLNPAADRVQPVSPSPIDLL